MTELTFEAIDAMPAGQGLDISAAKMLGHFIFEWDGFFYEASSEEFALSCQRDTLAGLFIGGQGSPGTRADFCWRLARYSTDIRRAWQVVENLIDSYRVRIGCDNWSWYCCEDTGCGDPDYGKFVAYADTAPLAICRAALKAKLLEDSDASKAS